PSSESSRTFGRFGRRMSRKSADVKFLPDPGNGPLQHPGAGRVDYDFAVVHVLDKEHPDKLPPSIHAAYYPTFGLNPSSVGCFGPRHRLSQGGRGDIRVLFPAK